MVAVPTSGRTLALGLADPVVILFKVRNQLVELYKRFLLELEPFRDDIHLRPPHVPSRLVNQHERPGEVYVIMSVTSRNSNGTLPG